MAEQILWLDGEAKVNGEIEKICPGRHITQKQWRPEWNLMYLTPRNIYCYDYISDYECIFNHPIDQCSYPDVLDQPLSWQNLQAAKVQGTNVPITNVAHFTIPEAARKIIATNGFVGRAKKINTDLLGNNFLARLSWWSPVFTDVEKTHVRTHLGTVIQPFLSGLPSDAILHSQFATSDAFVPNPRRYGNIFFSYGIDDLCKNYGSLVGGDVQYKILGTFAYKQEIMHTVLVCSQADGDGQFVAYPNVFTSVQDIFNNAVITRDNYGNWVWKPQASATEINRLHCTQQIFPMYRRWENVAFAFHIPDEWTVMTVSGNVSDHQIII